MNRHLALFALQVAGGASLGVWDHLTMSSIERVREAESAEGKVAARAALLEALLAAMEDGEEVTA